MKDLNWKEGLNRLYIVVCGLYCIAMFVAIFFAEENKLQMTLAAIAAPFIFLAIRYIAIWIYQGLEKKEQA